MNLLPFHPWLLFYPAAAISSLIIALQILKGRPKTLSSKNFLLFALSISLWETFAFLHRIAPNEDTSWLFLQFAIIFYSLNPLLLLMTVIFLWRENPKFYLLTIPAIPLYILHLMYVKVNIVPSSYGWSYNFEINTFTIIEYLIYLLCLLEVCFFIAFLIKRVKSSIIRRKYFIILVYFIVFYVIGVFGFNILLVENPEMPPPGGINTYLFFLGVSYAFSIREKTIKPEIGEIKDLLLKQYMSFINKFIEVVPGKELGQSLIELERYLVRVKLRHALEQDSEGRLILKPDALDKADLITIMEETIRYLEDKPWVIELSDSLLKLLNVSYMKVDDKNGFKRMLIRCQDFLKKTDIAYGLIGGEFIPEIGRDDSLRELPDWQACLRLCRRLISAILQDFYNNVGNTVESKMVSFSLLNHLRVSSLGEVEIKTLEEKVKSMPQNERIPALLDNFIPFIAWMVEELYKKLGENIDSIIKRLRLVLRLNMDVAVRTMVYNNLVESLSRRIPSTYISVLRLAEGFTERDLNRFSSRINLDHEKLVGKGILLEFEPGSTYLEYVSDYVIEALAHDDASIIITRKGSQLQDSLQYRRNVKFIHPSLMTLHTTTVSESEVYVPLQDVIQILESLGKSIKLSSSPVFVVFDSITDFLTQHGFEKTYRLIRSMLELNPLKVSLMVTLNIKAWGENVKSALEELLNITIRVD
ncbi:MAG: hypothetical protein FGF52_02710 [Candidatus Brockarchaeota archaeon]|nr:hypothetical protein [Candidatus Brockarchaeota archaeon]